MTAVWRLLDYSFDDPFMNLAMEESILRGKVEGENPDTLRLWQHPPVVSIGCFLNPEDEVRHPPQSGWLDERGCLKGRRPDS